MIRFLSAIAVLVVVAGCESVPDFIEGAIVQPCPTSIGDSVTYADTDEFTNRLRCELEEHDQASQQKTIVVAFDSKPKEIPLRADAFIQRAKSAGGQVKTCDVKPEQSAALVYEVLGFLGQKSLEYVEGNITYGAAEKYNVRLVTDSKDNTLSKIEFVEKDGEPLGC